jgi:hypothetical protein
MSHGAITGKKMGEIDADYRAVLGEQPLRVSCARCDWVFEGTAVEACAEQVAHRKVHRVKSSRKRYRRLSERSAAARAHGAFTPEGSGLGPRATSILLSPGDVAQGRPDASPSPARPRRRRVQAP